MNERAELFVRKVCSVEEEGDAKNIAHGELQVRVTGMLEQRALDFWVEDEAGVLREVANFGKVKGTGILVLSTSDLSNGHMAAITTGETEVVSAGGFYHVLLKERAVIDEDDFTPVAFSAPDMFWSFRDASNLAFWGAAIYSSPFNASYDTKLYLEAGTWHVLFLELDPDTVQVEVVRD
jgi:hypothetical protein